MDQFSNHEQRIKHICSAINPFYDDRYNVVLAKYFIDRKEIALANKFLHPINDTSKHKQYLKEYMVNLVENSLLYTDYYYFGIKQINTYKFRAVLRYYDENKVIVTVFDKNRFDNLTFDRDKIYVDFPSNTSMDITPTTNINGTLGVVSQYRVVLMLGSGEPNIYIPSFNETKTINFLLKPNFSSLKRQMFEFQDDPEVNYFEKSW